MNANLSLFTAFALGVASLNAASSIYEGFDYAAGTVSGGSGGVGFTGSWSTVITAPQVTAPGLDWGSLDVAGNFVQNASGGGGGARDIGATSVLDSDGLMGNGDTLWFSVVANKPATGNLNVDFNFALGTDGFANYGGGEFGQRRNLDGGEGIGFALINRNDTQLDIAGAYWQDDGDADSYANRNTNTGITRWNGPTALIVGRIDWGADDLASETLTLYMPDTDLNLGSSILSWTTIAALDQSAFDTIAFELKGGAGIDEIRFGSSYADVTPVPEPGAAMMMGLAAGMFLLRRRRSA